MCNPPPQIERPTITRLVLFRSEKLFRDGTIEVPALVTSAEDYSVSLTVFPPGDDPFPVTDVGHFDPDAPGPARPWPERSWRWSAFQQKRLAARKTSDDAATRQTSVGHMLHPPGPARALDPQLAAQNAAAAAVAKTPNRVTLEHIESLVVTEEYLRAGPTKLLTICILALQNGFTVTGESAAADPANFDEKLGQTIARRHAIEKVWPLEGYALRERMHRGPGERQ